MNLGFIIIKIVMISDDENDFKGITSSYKGEDERFSIALIQDAIR